MAIPLIIHGYSVNNSGQSLMCTLFFFHPSSPCHFPHVCHFPSILNIFLHSLHCHCTSPLKRAPPFLSPSPSTPPPFSTAAGLCTPMCLAAAYLPASLCGTHHLCEAGAGVLSRGLHHHIHITMEARDCLNTHSPLFGRLPIPSVVHIVSSHIYNVPLLLTFIMYLFFSHL